MGTRSHCWDQVAWKPPAGPADGFGAPRFTSIARTVRARWQPIFLVAGVLLVVLGMALPSAVAFVAGMLVVGSSVPDARPRSLTTAMIRAWAWLHESRAARPGTGP
jgi:hypothetical protein